VRKEYGDAVYECWARDGDSDALDYDDVDRLMDQGFDGYEAGAIIAREQHQQTQPQEPDPQEQAMLEYHQEFDLKRLEKENK
jgi:hypothetical protein